MLLVLKCTGEAGTSDCCTDEHPCELGGGDCDTNTNCAGELVCGNNRCKEFNLSAKPNYDCCIKAEGEDIPIV